MQSDVYRQKCHWVQPWSWRNSAIEKIFLVLTIFIFALFWINASRIWMSGRFEEQNKIQIDVRFLCMCVRARVREMDSKFKKNITRVYIKIRAASCMNECGLNVQTFCHKSFISVSNFENASFPSISEEKTICVRSKNRCDKSIFVDLIEVSRIK